jgi:hypothetical protein
VLCCPQSAQGGQSFTGPTDAAGNPVDKFGNPLDQIVVTPDSASQPSYASGSFFDPSGLVQISANNNGRRGPITRCPGLGGQPCGAPTADGGVNPQYPDVCPQCLDREQKWPFGGPVPPSLQNLTPAQQTFFIIVIVGGAIVLIPVGL